MALLYSDQYFIPVLQRNNKEQQLKRLLKINLLLCCMWQQQLNEIKQGNSKTVARCISIIENEIYIAIEIKREIFEINFKPFHKQEQRIKEDLLLFYDIFQLLNDINNIK